MLVAAQTGQTGQTGSLLVNFSYNCFWKRSNFRSIKCRTLDENEPVRLMLSGCGDAVLDTMSKPYNGSDLLIKSTVS